MHAVTLLIITFGDPFITYSCSRTQLLLDTEGHHVQVLLDLPAGQFLQTSASTVEAAIGFKFFSTAVEIMLLDGLGRTGC